MIARTFTSELDTMSLISRSNLKVYAKLGPTVGAANRVNCRFLVRYRDPWRRSQL